MSLVPAPRPLPPAIILVRPQLGENIGAVARAMSNFGLSDLRLVAPKNGWPNPRANEMAASGEHIVESARIFATLPEAMEGIQCAYGTTHRTRFMEKRVMEARDAALEITREAAEGKSAAILFGPERTGLENDDLILCDAITTIKTDTSNPSINISQAAVILAYECCRARTDLPPIARPAQTFPLADKAELADMFAQLETYLDEVNYFREPNRKNVMWRNLQNIFVRSQLSNQEVRTLRGVFRYLKRGKVED
jgi:tRNA/rRNA methyltransferase